jgi:hypothetical protein
VGGEDQLKALIRQTFSLQNVADKAVVNVDQVLAQVMANVKRLVETLPKEGLLRQKVWRDLEPLVKAELDKYGDRLGKSLVDAEVKATPKMRAYGVREFNHAGAGLPQAVATQGVPVAQSIEMALNSKVVGQTVRKMFNVDGKAKGQSPVNKALFKTVDTRVRGGLINGWPTQEIANLMATDVVAAGVPGVSLTAPVAKQIRSQSMAIARTATQDMQRQVKEELYEQNKEQLTGMVWMWSTALDSRTCETCAPLDQQRWDQGDSSRPDWPLHPNCRCEALLIDPKDKFWNETQRTAQQVKPATLRKKDKETGKWKTVKTKPYTGKGAYKTPVKVNGKKYWRRAVTVTSDRPPTRLADVYARWATDGTASLEAAMGPTRAAYFNRQFNEFNKDPEQILNAMLTGKPGAQKWLPVDKLRVKKTR